MNEFLEAIEDCDLDSLSKETRDQIALAQEKLLNRFGGITFQESKANVGHKHSNDPCGERARDQDSARANNLHDQSIVEIIAEKLDNRRVPPLRKFNEMGVESMDKFFDRFEDYCQQNIRGSKETWIDELEQYLEGETLEIYMCHKETTSSYNELQAAMIAWHKDMKENRQKRAISKFEKSAKESGESLFLFATKTEKLFRQAYPQGHVERSLILRNKFEKCLTKSNRSKLQNHKFALKMEDIPITWEMIKKWARTMDTFKAEQSSSEDESPSFKEKEICINVSEQKPKETSREVKVKYDPENKRFYLVEPEKYDLQDASVLATSENRRPYDNTRRVYDKNNDWKQAGSQNRSYGGRGEGMNVQNREYYNNSHRGYYSSNNRRGYFQPRGQAGGARPRQFPPVPEIRAVRCYACGRIGHMAKQCDSSPKVCFVCGEKGHMSFACQHRKGPRQQQDNRRQGEKSKQLNQQAS